MKIRLSLCLALVAPIAMAGSPQQIRNAYVAEAALQQPGFTASAQRGERLFRQSFSINEKMPACTSCHTPDPLRAGEHVVTGKTIRPLAVAGNGERFTDAARVEKWFGRNCKEVVGRACTSAEKADFVAYMSEVR